MIKLVDKKDYACTQTNLKFSFDTKLKLKLEILRNSVRKEIREAKTQYLKICFKHRIQEKAGELQMSN